MPIRPLGMSAPTWLESNSQTPNHLPWKAATAAIVQMAKKVKKMAKLCKMMLTSDKLGVLNALLSSSLFDEFLNRSRPPSSPRLETMTPAILYLAALSFSTVHVSLWERR